LLQNCIRGTSHTNAENATKLSSLQSESRR
jgi:hypothetical protein